MTTKTDEQMRADFEAWTGYSEEALSRSAGDGYCIKGVDNEWRAYQAGRAALLAERDAYFFALQEISHPEGTRASATQIARAAVEPYAQRIAELETQLEAIGAGGVTQGQKLLDDDRKRRGEPVKCPDPSMGEHACSNRDQCWEPCGELGSSVEHARVAEPVKVPVIEPSDLRVDTYPAEPHSAWIVKADTGVRVTHVPTGLSAACHEDRSVHRNRALAMEKLQKMLQTHEPVKVPSDAELLDLATLCGINHSVIDTDYCRAVELPEGTRHIADDVRPENTVAFARALLARYGQQAQPVVFTDANCEERFTEHEANACSYCGGSGHKDDVQPAEPVKLPSDDERAAQGLPPYNPRLPTDEEMKRLTENGRKAWGKDDTEPVKVPSDQDLAALFEQVFGDGFKTGVKTFEFARLVLARYGQPAQPAEWEDFPK